MNVCLWTIGNMHANIYISMYHGNVQYCAFKIIQFVWASAWGKRREVFIYFIHKDWVKDTNVNNFMEGGKSIEYMYL